MGINSELVEEQKKSLKKKAKKVNFSYILQKTSAVNVTLFSIFSNEAIDLNLFRTNTIKPLLHGAWIM